VYHKSIFFKVSAFTILRLNRYFKYGGFAMRCFYVKTIFTACGRLCARTLWHARTASRRLERFLFFFCARFYRANYRVAKIVDDYENQV